MLAYGEFEKLIVDSLQLIGGGVDLSVGRFATLDLDSLDRFILLSTIEDLAEVVDFSLEDRVVTTMDDAYGLYQELKDTDDDL